ncbi:response regulator transcription factor [Paenibacillus thailandensis]|uniref:Response regulator transcription factor n=1 Tax=Paenibacillus thailandensis TaxID=393250 RepID=A0ABW5R1Q9_9BACL
MKRITILIADDEPEIVDLVALHMEKEGYRTIKAFDGRQAVQAIQSTAIDLAILDIMMPGLDGHEATRLVRENHSIPIIFLSAKTSDMDKIAGLVIGADDYVTKPFNPMELVARVNAQLRRARLNSRQDEGRKSAIEAGGLVIDPDSRTLLLYGKEVELTPKEFDILYLLMSHPKRVFSAEHLFQQVWGEAYFESGNTVMVHIRTLRKKLGDDKNKFIKTVWGVGYTFNG